MDIYIFIGGILIHIIFIWSMFDIYFESSIIPVENQYQTIVPGAAKRLVLFLCDGLHADTMYNLTDNATFPLRSDTDIPFLNSIVAHGACWGVSFGPRPGHAAIMTGVYESLHSFTKFTWNKPIILDSVLNQSRYTWCWGSKQICRGYSVDRSQSFHVAYDDEQLPSTPTDLHQFESWLSDNVLNFLQVANKDRVLIERLYEDKLLFVIELGHIADTYQPGPQYLAKYVSSIDKSVSKIANFIDEYYNDNRTTYLLTSSRAKYAMANEHFQHREVTSQTPFIAWGAGLNRTLPSENATHRTRADIRQSDISVLLSLLLGTSIPKNSMGTIPDRYLNMKMGEWAEALYTILLHRLEQFKTIKFQKSLSYRFKSFDSLNDQSLRADLHTMDEFFWTKHYQEAIVECTRLIDLVTEGLDYYQHFHSKIILYATLLSMFMWVLILMEFVLRNKLIDIAILAESRSFLKLNLYCTHLFYGFMFMVVTITCYIVHDSNLSSRFIIYLTLPEILLCVLFFHYETWLSTLYVIIKSSSSVNLKRLMFIAGYGLALELMVMSFVIRHIFTLVTIMVGTWLVICNTDNLWRRDIVLWISSTTLVAIFQMVPPMDDTTRTVILACGGFAWISAAIWVMYYLWEMKKPEIQSNVNDIYIVKGQLIDITIAVCLVLVNRTDTIPSEYYFFWRIASWYIAGFSILLLLFCSQLLIKRLCHLLLMMSVPTMLLSAAHEPLFLLFFGVNMFHWLWSETSLWIRSKNNFELMYDPSHEIHSLSFGSFEDACKQRFKIRDVHSGDFRRAYFMVFYILLSFHGTSSTDDHRYAQRVWIECLVCDLQEDLSAIFSICKYIIPLVLTAAFCRAVVITTKAPLDKMLVILWIFLDFIGMHLLSAINCESPGDLENSVANFLLIESCIFLIFILYGLSIVCTSVTLTLRNQLKIIRTEFVDKI